MGKPKGVDWESWIDEQVRQAQERGEFDNLPGRGQRLDLTPNPYAPDQELAFKVLKDAGYAPEWLELDKAIRKRTDRARATLVRRWQWHQGRLRELALQSNPWANAERGRVEDSWQQAITDFEEELTEINLEIRELNLKVPSAQFQRARLNGAREIERVLEEET